MNSRSSRNGTQSLQPLAASLFWATLATSALSAAACGSGADECISLKESCSPTLSTDYNTIYASVLSTSCGTGAGVTTCHGSAGSPSGLSLADPNYAYTSLLSGAPHARVVPGDPACSPLMARLTSGDANVRMPKGGAPLGEGVVCAIQSWIREGAVR